MRRRKRRRRRHKCTKYNEREELLECETKTRFKFIYAWCGTTGTVPVGLTFL